MISNQKKELRKSMLQKRSAINSTQKAVYDNWICNELRQYIKEKKYKTIHVYLPMSAEINILPLIRELLEDNLTLIAPKTLKKPKLQNLYLQSLSKLEKGVFGTVHPAESKAYSGAYDLIIVPGLAFDNSKNRLGYGGAYYDTFLKDHPDADKVAIFYPFQLVNTVPIEPHDIQLDKLLYNTKLALV